MPLHVGKASVCRPSSNPLDPTERTITLIFDFGEGGGIIQWAHNIGEAGTTTHGKKAIHVNDGGLGTDYFGCFPIAIQQISGFERDIKGRMKVVISYDTTAPGT